MNFRRFIEAKMTEEDKNLRDTLSRLPVKHRRLVHNYDINYQTGNTLDGDDQHVGYIDDKKKVIALASPWRYSREFTFLHELGHAVYNHLMSKELQTKWKDISGEGEESFCMTYASTYAQHAPVTYAKKKLIDFIKNDVPK